MPGQPAARLADGVAVPDAVERDHGLYENPVHRKGAKDANTDKGKKKNAIVIPGWAGMTCFIIFSFSVSFAPLR
jgi:hypothetical protein